MGFVPIAALVLSAIGTAASIQQSSKASEEADNQAKLSAALAEQKRVHDLRGQINSSRVQRAQALVSGMTQTGTSGGGESSAVQGALGSAQTQMASEVGFAATTGAAYDSIYKSERRANKYTSNAATAGSLANFSSQFGINWASAFNQNPTGTEPTPKTPPGQKTYSEGYGF